MKSLLIIFFFSLQIVKAATIEERLNLLEEKLEENEIERSLERFRFSGTFINYGELIDSHTKIADTNEQTQDSGMLMGLHLGLNIDATISKNVSFLSTIGMGKVWNNDGREGFTEQSYRIAMAPILDFHIMQFLTGLRPCMILNLFCLKI